MLSLQISQIQQTSTSSLEVEPTIWEFGDTACDGYPLGPLDIPVWSIMRNGFGPIKSSYPSSRHVRQC